MGAWCLARLFKSIVRTSRGGNFQARLHSLRIVRWTLDCAFLNTPLLSGQLFEWRIRCLGSSASSRLKSSAASSAGIKWEEDLVDRLRLKLKGYLIHPGPRSPRRRWPQCAAPQPRRNSSPLLPRSTTTQSIPVSTLNWSKLGPDSCQHRVESREGKESRVAVARQAPASVLRGLRKPG